MKKVSFWHRIMIYLYDSFAIMTIIALTFLILAKLEIKTSEGEDFFLIIGIFILYYYLMEITFNQTIGKMFYDAIIVDENGNPPSKKQLLKRTLLKYHPFDGIYFLLKGEFLHDKYAKTQVVYKT